MQLHEIYTIASGLNIEGGHPQRDLMKFNPKALWVNLILVLDRPLIDKVVFDDIFANNKYPLLESAIEEINENHFLAAYLMIIGFYLSHGHVMCSKNKKENLNITIHIHQDVKAQALVELLNTYLESLIHDRDIDTSHINLKFCTDYKTYAESTPEYIDTDLLISLSQCAGLDPSLVPGTLIIPINFIPFDIDNNIIHQSQSYCVPNQLIENIVDMLQSTLHDYCIDFVNKNHKSANLAKDHKAKFFDLSDFKYGDILQVNKLWNPEIRAESMPTITFD